MKKSKYFELIVAVVTFQYLEILKSADLQFEYLCKCFSKIRAANIYMKLMFSER